MLRTSFLLLALAAPLFAQTPIRGFFPEELSAEHDLEQKAFAIPQPARIHIYMERMASKPHPAGSPASKAVADYLAAQMKEWGLEVRTETFEALMPYPSARSLEMVSFAEPAVSTSKPWISRIALRVSRMATSSSASRMRRFIRTLPFRLCPAAP